MATLKNLKKEAIESCDFRGHKMSSWADGADGKPLNVSVAFVMRGWLLKLILWQMGSTLVVVRSLLVVKTVRTISSRHSMIAFLVANP